MQGIFELIDYCVVLLCIAYVHFLEYNQHIRMEKFIMAHSSHSISYIQQYVPNDNMNLTRVNSKSIESNRYKIQHEIVACVHDKWSM